MSKEERAQTLLRTERLVHKLQGLLQEMERLQDAVRRQRAALRRCPRFVKALKTRSDGRSDGRS